MNNLGGWGASGENHHNGKRRLEGNIGRRLDSLLTRLPSVLFLKECSVPE